MDDSTALERALGAGFGRLFRPYFEGLTRGRLVVPKCESCARHQFPPRSLCVHCQSRELGWEAVAEPKGTLFSWTVVHHAKGTKFEALIPYAAALISLDEIGIRLYGLVRDPEGLDIGKEVRLVFPTTVPTSDGADEVLSAQELDRPVSERPHWVLADTGDQLEVTRE